jgi:rod shape-determining protein MreD
MDRYQFHPAVTLLVPVAAVMLQALLPKSLPRLAILDLPLIVVIFFAVSRRSPVAGTIIGMLVGLFQDALTGHALGINGIAKAIIGYIAASLGFAIDMENLISRIAASFVFCLMQSGMLFLIERYLLADRTVLLMPGHELIRAVCNAAVAVPVFLILDRFRVRD